MDRPRIATDARERGIVQHDRLARAAEPNVELDAVGPLGERSLERLERVLGGPALPSPASMTEDDQVASSSEISRASFCARSTSPAGSEIAPTTGWPPPP